MKPGYLLALFNLATVSTALSQNASFIAGEIAQISACGVRQFIVLSNKGEVINSEQLSCLTHTIPDVGCTLTNTTCQCSSTRLVQTTSACMMANCTLAETLGTYPNTDKMHWLTTIQDLSKIQAAICERPYQSQNKKIRIMTIVCAVITNSAALTRFSTRILLNQTFDSDDWFIAAAVVSFDQAFIKLSF